MMARADLMQRHKTHMTCSMLAVNVSDRANVMISNGTRAATSVAVAVATGDKEAPPDARCELSDRR